jgi:hypothetical protein
MKSRIVCLFLALALASLVPSTASALTPVLFTTNDGPYPAANGPYRVSYITVYVDNVKKCYTESNGNCTATPNLAPGLHEVTYVWATCNNPDSCAHFGEVIHYVLVPDQATTFYVRIPTVRVRWYTEYGVGISLNGQWRVWALGGGTGTTNVMSGCYTASYYKPYPGPAPAWPAIGAVPDPSLKGFDGVCVGSNDTYPEPEPDNGTDTTPPHVRFTIPDYWP